MNEKDWSPRRAYELRLDSLAQSAVEAIDRCGDDRALTRFLRRLADHWDDRKTTSRPGGPPRAA